MPRHFSKAGCRERSASISCSRWANSPSHLWACKCVEALWTGILILYCVVVTVLGCCHRRLVAPCSHGGRGGIITIAPKARCSQSQRAHPLSAWPLRVGVALVLHDLRLLCGQVGQYGVPVQYAGVVGSQNLSKNTKNKTIKKVPCRNVDGLECGDGESGGLTCVRLGLGDDVGVLCYGEDGTLTKSKLEGQLCRH
ncbi:hypothetical protein EDB89DRAFT_2017286 [Lactarius sanguifluus]|nr:hypothetical protein EDB89DRAFT_2017286 [Lactarius sanguifluus]